MTIDKVVITVEKPTKEFVKKLVHMIDNLNLQAGDYYKNISVDAITYKDRGDDWRSKQEKTNLMQTKMPEELFEI